MRKRRSALGVTEYLLKPVDFDLLYAVLRRIVGDHDAAGARPHKPESAALTPPARRRRKTGMYALCLTILKKIMTSVFR